MFAVRTLLITAPTSSTVAAMVAPASERARILSEAVAALPVTMAPAWPIRLPGGAERPATRATSGLVKPPFLMNSAASCSRFPAYLSYQHHRFRFGVFLEHGQHVYETGAHQGVAANADTGGLADTYLGQGVDRFVSERSTAGDDAYVAQPCVFQTALCPHGNGGLVR